MGVRRGIAEIGDTADERFEALACSFDRILTGVRRREPQATVVLVDYLTLLPPDEDTAADREGRDPSRLRLPGGLVRQPRPPRLVRPALDDGVPSLPARGAPCHPNAAGMRPGGRPARSRAGTLAADRVTGWSVSVG